MTTELNDNQLLRYSRQIMLPDVDVEGQEKLLAAKVLIVGLGGLGCPVAMYLASSGVGHLVLADDDNVDLTNLQRQIAHATNNVGDAKVASAKDTLLNLNPEIQVEEITSRLSGKQLQRQVAEADIVLDCSDNFSTRFALNRACVEHKTPLVSGAAIRMEGQVSVFNASQPDSPCYRCLYEDGEDSNLSCAESGVLGPVVGAIGSLQAIEAIKLIVGAGRSLQGRLLMFDALQMQWREFAIPKDPGCPVCGSAA